MSDKTVSWSIVVVLSCGSVFSHGNESLAVGLWTQSVKNCSGCQDSPDTHSMMINVPSSILWPALTHQLQSSTSTVSGLMHFTLQGSRRPKWHQEGKKINKYFSDGRMECILLNSEQPFFLLLLIKNVLVCKHSNIHNIGHRCRKESGVRWCFKLVLKLRWNKEEEPGVSL